MPNIIQTFIDSFRKCDKCSGRGITEKWKGIGERMLVEGELKEIATLENREVCEKCKGTGKRW